MVSALFLIALVMGYKVFVEAGKEKENIKLLGKVIGIVVMVLSILGASCSTCYDYGAFLRNKFGAKRKMGYQAPRWQAPAQGNVQAPAPEKAK